MNETKHVGAAFGLWPPVLTNFRKLQIHITTTVQKMNDISWLTDNITPIPPPRDYEEKIPVARPYIPDVEAPVVALDVEQGHPKPETTPPPVEKEPKRPRYFRNRLILLAFFSVLSFLGSWFITDLSFKRLPRIMGPSKETADEILDNIYGEPKSIAAVWEQCIRNEATRCRNVTRTLANEERARIEAIQASNLAKVEQAAETKNQCYLTLREAKSSLQRASIGDGLPWKTCPDEERMLVLDAANNNLSKGIDGMVDAVFASQRENREQMVDIQKWAGEYARYHTDFFSQTGPIANLLVKLLLEIEGFAEIDIALPGMEGLITCLDPSTYSIVPCPIIPLAESLDAARNLTSAYIQVANEQIQGAARVIATLVDRYDWAVGNILELVRIIRAVRNVLGRPFDLAWNSLGGINLNQFDNISPGFLFVDKNLDFPTIPNAPQFQQYLDDFRDELLKVHAATRRTLADVNQGLRDKTDKTIEIVVGYFDELFEVYSPPPFPGFENEPNFDFLVRVFDERNDRLMARLNDAIENFNGVAEDTVDPDQLPEFTPDDIDFDVSDQFEGPTSVLLGLKELTWPEFIVSIITLFSDFGKWFELARRISMWFFRFRQFFHQSAVPVPKIVIGTPGSDREEEEDEEEQARKHRCVKIYECSTGGISRKVFIAVCALGSLGVVLYSLYSSVTHYRGRCVLSQTGTEFTQNVVLPGVHDASKAKGSALLLSLSFGLHAEKVSTCKRMQASSNLAYQRHSANLFVSKYDYNATMEQSSLIVDCIDVPSLGDNGTLLQDGLQKCSVPMDISLEYGVASCGDWPVCDIKSTCGDADVSERITASIIKNTCAYEWHIMSELVIFFLEVFQYCLMWFVQHLVESALFALLRKKLRRDSVKWVYEQDVFTGEIVGAEGKTLAEAKAEALAKYERREKWTAVGYLFLAFILVGGFIALRVWLAITNDYLKPQGFDLE